LFAVAVVAYIVVIIIMIGDGQPPASAGGMLETTCPRQKL